MLADYFPFKALIRHLDPQLIHFHFVSEGGRWFYWNGIDVPMVASTWGQDVIFDTGPRPKAQKSLRKILAKCRLITSVSHQLAAATVPHAPPGRPIYVVPFGVDLNQFPMKEPAHNGTITLGFVKHLLPKYGPDVLVEAFSIIHRARPATRLILAGRGDMRESLQQRIDELGLTSAIDIVGRVPHERVPALIRSFDLMVMPSVYESETFGVAAIEASASGVPFVASRIGGIPEAVINGKTGLLVPPRDPQALAAACIKLIDDPIQREQMGQMGREFVERYYSWAENGILMEEVYRAELDGDDPNSVPAYTPGRLPDLSI